MARNIRRVLLCSCTSLLVGVACLVGLIVWPSPLFAYSLSTGRIVVSSDRPIPAAAAARVLRDCEARLERSPLPPAAQPYHLYVTNADWRRRLFFIVDPQASGYAYYTGRGGNAFLSGADFAANRLIHRGYVQPPPRTLAYFCAHELTHIVTGEHLGIVGLLRLPQWVREGFADYVAIEPRESFEQLADALRDRPVDNRMMQQYGSYPRDRLLVTWFLEKKGWSIQQLLKTKLSLQQALVLMRGDNRS